MVAKQDYTEYTVVGLNEVGKAAPRWVTRLVALLYALLGTAASIIHHTDAIMPDVKADILFYLGTATAAITTISTIFGVRTRKKA